MSGGQKARVLTLAFSLHFCACGLYGCNAADRGDTVTMFVLGDTGSCEDGTRQVSAAIRRERDWNEGRLLLLGDLAYPESGIERMRECHEPFFSAFNSRLAVPGNHDWLVPEAAGFFHFYPEPIPRAIRLTNQWRLYLLDSNFERIDADSHVSWLENELKTASNQCIIAAWHHPRWSSGRHGDQEHVAPYWSRLVGHATFTLHAHDHHFEALPELDIAGKPKKNIGLRSFIVGTGGAALYQPGRLRRSDRAFFGRWGFMRIDISGKRYSWKAIDVGGKVIDQGNGECDSRPPKSDRRSSHR